MAKYNSKIAKLDNLEFVQISGDDDLKEAIKWAAKEKFPWPTILKTDLKNTFIKDIKVASVPLYVLVSRDGKEISRSNGSAAVIAKYEELAE